MKYTRVLFLISLIILVPIHLRAQSRTIKIGLLIPDTSQNKIINACELAIEAGSFSRLHPEMNAELVVRTTRGPWGMGSKASVNLIYEDGVAALLCALDGRNAHLAEQVTAKTQIACLETKATDPTLTQAYVPWYLRCVPSDDQQAQVIFREIEKMGGGKTAIICTGEYDTRMTVHSFTKAMARMGIKGPVILDLSMGEFSARDLSDLIRAKNIGSIIITLNLSLMDDLVSILRTEMPELKIFGTYAFSSTIELGEVNMQKYEGMYLLTSALPLSDQGINFTTTFTKRFGYQPDIAAAYAYDGMGLIISAIKSQGGNRERIRDYLIHIQYDAGLTGQISFDEMGNRINAARIIRIVNGKPVRIN